MNLKYKYLKYKYKYHMLLAQQIGGAAAPVAVQNINAQEGDLVNLKSNPSKIFRVLKSKNEDFTYTVLDEQTDTIIEIPEEELELFTPLVKSKPILVFDLSKYPELSLGPIGEMGTIIPSKKSTKFAGYERLDNIDKLPEEIIFNIIKFLECDDIMRLSQTNRNFRKLIIDNIRYIYDIMTKYYEGIAGLISRDDINDYPTFVKICGLIKK